MIGPGVHHFFFVSDPGADVLASGGDNFVRQGGSECLGVEWGVCLFLGLGFSRGGSGCFP